jgi:predicted nucleic acid-binding protein
MLVLDANVAVAIALDEKLSSLPKDILAGDERIISTDLFHIEVTQALTKYVQSELITQKQAIRLLYEAAELVDDFYTIEEDSLEALNESLRLNHSSYDMLYLILARRFGATLVTLDKKLIKLCLRENLSILTDVPFE